MGISGVPPLAVKRNPFPKGNPSSIINGFLVPVRDSDSIAIELINIIKMDSSEVINVINSAKQTILENHLLKLQIKKMIILYKSIINSYNK